MTWILPKSLQSRFAPDMKVLAWGSSECFQACASSLTRRSKSMPARSWRNAWKRGSLMLPRSGLILEPSQEQRFTERWASSFADFRANHSPSPASGKAEPTSDTFGRILRASSAQLSLFGSSSKTCRDYCQPGRLTTGLTCADTLPSWLSSNQCYRTPRCDTDCGGTGSGLQTTGSEPRAYQLTPQFTSAYETWAIKLRADFSVRQSAVRPTSGNGCSSWPTARAEDAESCGGHNSRNVADSLRAAVTWPTPNQTDYKGSSQPLGRRPACDDDLPAAVDRIWPTPNAPNGGRSSNTTNYRQDGSKRQVDLQALVQETSNVKTESVPEMLQTCHRQGICQTGKDLPGMPTLLWPTPQEQDHKQNGQRENSNAPSLSSEIARWPTPAAANYRDGRASPETMARNSRPLQEVVISGQPDPASPNTTGKPPAQWLTPHGFMGQEQDGTYGGGGEFAKQVNRWSTPRAEEKCQHNSQDNSQALSRQIQWMTPEAQNQAGYQVVNGKRIPRLGTQAKGKLNPDWVEQLMGLPSGWTAFDYSETGSCLPKQNLPSEP